ncbi:1642_t:CDS:2, partial [Racocetra persica]
EIPETQRGDLASVVSETISTRKKMPIPKEVLGFTYSTIRHIHIQGT